LVERAAQEDIEEEESIFNGSSSSNPNNNIIENIPKAQFLEYIANTTNQGGQAVVATMRQGQSNAALNQAGVLTASDIPLIPNPAPQAAQLSTATYTVQQAVANIKF
jgi:hypothetical protein